MSNRLSTRKRNRIIADYEAGLSQNAVAKKHKVSPATAHKLIKAAGVSRSLSGAKAVEFADLRAQKAAQKAAQEAAERAAAEKEEAELTLTGGQWVRDGLVMRWQPFQHFDRNLSPAELRVKAEERMFTDEEARESHRLHAGGWRDARTIVGERVYQRRKKRARKTIGDEAA